MNNVATPCQEVHRKEDLRLKEVKEPSETSIAPKANPKEEQVEIKPSRLRFHQLMGYLDNPHQGKQRRMERSDWGASIASVSAEIGVATTKRTIEAISSLKSRWKPKSPRQIRSRQGKVKKLGVGPEKAL